MQGCACLDSPAVFLAFVWNNKEKRRTSLSVYLCMSMCEWVARGCLHLCVSDYLCAKQRTCLQVWVDAQVGREYVVCSLEWMQTLTDRPLFRWRSVRGRCVTRTFVYFGVPQLSDGCAGLFGDQVICGCLRPSFFKNLELFIHTLNKLTNVWVYESLISLILFISITVHQSKTECKRDGERTKEWWFMSSTMTERAGQAATTTRFAAGTTSVNDHIVWLAPVVQFLRKSLIRNSNTRIFHITEQHWLQHWENV